MKKGYLIISELGNVSQKQKYEEDRNVNKKLDILSFEVLEETYKQLKLRNNSELENEISRILANNKVTKPDLHNSKSEPKTNYYIIDLSTDQIELIVTMFGELEVFNLGVNYESTKSAMKFANLLDEWNELPCYR